MHFLDREKAGKALAKKVVKKYRSAGCIVYGLPRGGVVPAYEVARQLHAPLGVILVKKIGHPLEPEYAIAAISEHGHFVENSQEIQYVSDVWLAKEIAQQKEVIKKRRLMYEEELSPKGKIAILVDDGIATGLTIRAALADIEDGHPKKIVIATPIISRDVMKQLNKIADDVIALENPKIFSGSIGSYYDFFPQITDEEVCALLQKSVTIITAK